MKKILNKLTEKAYALKNARKQNGKKGFTLIELVVVIAIIAILITLIAPNLIGYVGKAKEVKGKAAAKSVYTAIVAHESTGGTKLEDTSASATANAAILKTSGAMEDYFNQNEISDITAVETTHSGGTLASVKITMDGADYTYPAP